MIAATERPAGVGSRIVGRGRLLVSLRALLRRVQKFAEHRAGTSDERAWAARLGDDLEAAYVAGLSAPGARAGLDAVDRRRSVSRKQRLEPEETR